MVYCAADTSCAGGGTVSQAFPSNRLSAIGKFSRRSSSWSVLGERSRQRCTGAIDYNPGAALAGVLGGDEFAVVAQRPVCLHSRCYRAGSFHIADARHFYRRCPYPFLANLPTQADHGAWHPGDSVDRKFGSDCRARRVGNWRGVLVALAGQTRVVKPMNDGYNRDFGGS